MTTNELMIGDFVSQKESGIILEVSEIHPPFIYANGYDGQFNDFEPIKLTPEILLKNGFELQEEDANIIKLEFYTFDKIILRKRPDGTWKVLIGDSINDVKELFGDANFIGTQCSYVHELQHIIKICLPDKKIML